MVDDETRSERISLLRKRVDNLTERGTDAAKVRNILDNLESTIESTEEEKAKEALDKFERLISKMESIPGGGKTGKGKRKITRRKAVIKSDRQIAPTEGTVATEEEASISEEESPSGEEGEQPVERAPEETAPGEEQEVPADSVEPVEEVPERMDIETANGEIESVEKMLEEIGGYKGDTSAILPHLDALKRARDEEDAPSFSSYLSTIREWALRYLGILRRSRIDSIIKQIESRISEFSNVGEEESVKVIEEEMKRSLEGYDSADADALVEIGKDLEGLFSRIEELFNKLMEELTRSVNESTEKIESMINEISGDIDTTPLKDDLLEVKELLFNGEFIKAKIGADALFSRVETEKSSWDMRKLESMLLSIESLLEKIGEVEGRDARTYLSLKKEREDVMELSRENVQGALNLMADLLDKASIISAEVDEKIVRELQERISAERENVRSLEGTLDISPVMKIIDKAEVDLINGQVEEARAILEKAHLAFERLRKKKAFEVAAFKLEEARGQVSSLAEKGLDVSPLEAPLSEASRAIQASDMESLDKLISLIEERLQLLRNEELKVDYQKMLIKVMNGLGTLKKDGQETSDLEEELENFKHLYMERKFEEALDAAGGLLHRIGGRKIYRALMERKSIVEETSREAEGLLVDVDGLKEKISTANDLIEGKEYEAALDLFCEAQVMLEEKMTQRTFSLVENEIRSLAAQCSEDSIDPGDFNGVISRAYSMADEEKFNEALELLSRFREGLSIKVKKAKTGTLMEEMGQLIKEGRMLCLTISPFKASLTKARVLVDAGDVDAALPLMEDQVAALRESISEKKAFQTQLDRLRGNLLAQKGKISRLGKSGVDVSDLMVRIGKIEQLIEDSNKKDAEVQLASLDSDINTRLVQSPRRLKTEMVATIMEKKEEVRPLSIDRLSPKEEPAREEEIDPETARSELFILIPKIKVEITRMNSKGMDTEEFKKDIESIQHLVIQRKYIDAYRLGKDCYSRMVS